jgi:hypothetical protein
VSLGSVYNWNRWPPLFDLTYCKTSSQCQTKLIVMHYKLSWDFLSLSFVTALKLLFPTEWLVYLKNRPSLLLNPFQSYVGPRPTLWFSCSRRFSWSLALTNPIFLPLAYSPVLIYFGRERSWWITCDYPTVLKEKNRNRTHKNHNVGLRPTLWFSCSWRFSSCSTNFSQQIS